MSEQHHPGGRKYLTIKELSGITGFSITQIRRLVSGKKLPFYQPGGKGGKLLFPANAIEGCTSNDPVSNPDDESKKPLPGRPPKWMND